MLAVEFFPFPYLATARCLLGRIKENDAPQILALRSDEQTMKYVMRNKMTTLTEALEFIAVIDKTLESNAGISWGIYLRSSEKLVGTIGLWKIMNEHYRAEIGYSLLPEHCGKGLMTEVLNAVIRYGFAQLKLHSIEANTDPENLASIALLKKCGFVQEGNFKENFFFDGKFYDTASFSLLSPYPFQKD